MEDYDTSSLTGICAGIEILLLQKEVIIPNWADYSVREIGLIIAGREQSKLEESKAKAQMDWILRESIKDVIQEVVYNIMPSPKGCSKKPYPTRDFFDFYGGLFPKEIVEAISKRKAKIEEEKIKKQDEANIRTRLAYMQQIKAQQEARNKNSVTNEEDKDDEE